MPDCCKCTHGIGEGESIFCQSCVNLLQEELDKAQRKAKRLEQELGDKKTKITALELKIQELEKELEEKKQGNNPLDNDRRFTPRKSELNRGGERWRGRRAQSR